MKRGRIAELCGGFLLLACVTAVSLRGEEETPFTRLFDTGTSSVQPLADEIVVKRAGWTLVPEDQVEHRFSGDAVLLNDKLAVVVRKHERAVEVYSKAAAGLKHRATLAPVDGSSSGIGSPDALKIIENTSSAVMVEASFKGGGSTALCLRLTAGEAILEIRPGEGAKSVQVLTKTRYVVVPDYFGDDMVFDTGAPSARPSSPLGERGTLLPAENLCLNLLDGGDAILMTVVQSSEQDVWLTGDAGSREQGPGRDRCSSQINCLKDKSIWLAFLESPGLWHAGVASARGAWKPPFAAKWRCSLLHTNGVADSWTTEKPDGTVPERSADSVPVPPGHTTVKRTEVPAPSGPLLVYLIDRRAATPLTATCPTDVMRSTLGVGPCQYILACEGFAAQDDPTPNGVMSWVEKQFEQNKAKKAADDVKERLEVMTEHVAEARTRIQSYGEFAGQVRKLLANKAGAEPFLQIAEDLDRSVAIGLMPTASVERARQWAGDVAGLLGVENALAACQRLGAQLRLLGAAQDGTLAKCRMAVRRLRAQSKTEAANHSPASDLALEVGRLAELRLQKR